MRKFTILFATALMLLHSAFAATAVASDKPYVVLDEDLTKLKEDFNAKAGAVRLLFILGPTCGICLRGMADLNDEFLADSQNDPRLHTYAIYVPALNAEEKHISPAMTLMNGSRIYNYWDGAGTIGAHYQKVLNIDVWAWDVWLIYGPDAVWEGETPPEPDFWQHQLQPLPKETRLDKEVFAAETLARVKRLDLAKFEGTKVGRNESPLSDGAVIPWVGQGPGRPIGQYVETAQGGKNAIKAIQRREYQGKIAIGDNAYKLSVIERRPNVIDRTLMLNGEHATASLSDGVVQRSGELGLAPEWRSIEDRLLSDFDFDTPLVDWSRKGNKFSMEGMEKADGALNWRLVQAKTDGGKRVFLIDSHTGLIERLRIYDKAGKLVVALDYSDFKDVEGVPVAHRIDYRDADGRTIAVETFSAVCLIKTTS